MKIFTGTLASLPDARPGWDGGAILTDDICVATATGLVQIAAAGVPYHPEFVAAVDAALGTAKPSEHKGKTPPENKGSK